MSQDPSGVIEETVAWFDLFSGQVEMTVDAGHAGSGLPLDLHRPAPPGKDACAPMRCHFILEDRCGDLIEINAATT
jgi:hypothetical protein